MVLRNKIEITDNCIYYNLYLKLSDTQMSTLHRSITADPDCQTTGAENQKKNQKYFHLTIVYSVFEQNSKNSIRMNK